VRILPDSFVSIFSDIAAEIGMSRPAGQCLAAIWRAPAPPCADDLTATLGLARSNVSTALKELRAWGLVTVARRPGDRREYFTAPENPWDLVRLILAARHRRGLAPIIDRLLAVEATGENSGAAALHDTAARVGSWLAVLGQMDAKGLAAYVASVAGDVPKKKKKKR
jgi:DNA-binding transcriptional regulator GbsR (MarR family)